MCLLSWDPGEQGLPLMNICLSGSSMKPGIRKVLSTMDWITMVFWVESAHYLARIYRLFFSLGKFITLSIVFHTSGLSTLIFYSRSSSGRCFSHKSIRLFTRIPRKCHLLCQCKIWLCLIRLTFAFILCMMTLNKTSIELLPKCPPRELLGLASEYCLIWIHSIWFNIIAAHYFLARVKSPVHVAAEKKKRSLLPNVYTVDDCISNCHFKPFRSSEEEPIRGSNRHSFARFVLLPKLWTLEFLNLKHDLGQEREIWSGTRRKQRVERS